MASQSTILRVSHADSVTAADLGTRLLVGESPAMQEVRRMIGFAAEASISVLITGPSGSGKEVVARALHACSKADQSCFVAVNCGAIPRDLLESELFGHERGSFTGAIAQRKGRFETASGGTLFLDEIGDMPFAMQVKLLRVLEERVIERVGGGQPIAVNARIVSATHQNLDSAISDGRFREDLFYRLSAFPIEIPALRTRREDIRPLIRHFIAASTADDPMITFSPAALAALERYDWPGNVRELRNAIERAAVLFPQMEISAEQVSVLFRRRASTAPTTAADALPSSFPGAEKPRLAKDFDLKRHLQREEQRYMLSALRQAEGVVAEAAALLRVQRTTFVEKMKRYKIGREMALRDPDKIA